METNLKVMNALCDELAEIREKKTALNQQLKALNESEEIVEGKILHFLEGADLDSFDGTKGSVSVVNRFSVRVPQSIDDKKALFKYLQERKIFFELVGVNSMTLNSFYKTEMEIAAKNGDVDFKIPGVGAPALNKTLSFRKKGN